MIHLIREKSSGDDSVTLVANVYDFSVFLASAPATPVFNLKKVDSTSCVLSSILSNLELPPV